MFDFTKFRRVKPALTASAALSGLVAACPAFAQSTVDLRFEPPAVEVSNLCATRSPDEIVLDRWQDWDGQSLSGMNPDDVARDMRRLSQIDPIFWFDTVDKVIDLMPTISAGYTEEKAMVERAELMIAAGKLRELANLRIVPELLNRDTATSSRVQRSLAQFLIKGYGIEADRELGLQYLVAAAKGGNADAILEVVSMELEGEEVPDWQVRPELAVSMAFGALLGEMDPLICDRITRIAREYKNGDIVTRDVNLSERWYRLAADLGDTNAAWKVAELHMRSEELDKDNDTLLHYLELAAQGGNPFVRISLGRVYEIGALVPQDLERAAAQYRTAAANGDRGALVRQTLFLNGHYKTDPALKDEYVATLTRLSDRDDAPAWAYLDRAELILDQKGRWDGAAEAETFIAKAAELGDQDGLQEIAIRTAAMADTDARFYYAVDQLVYAVHATGSIDAMNDLQDTLICRARETPLVTEGLYWKAAEIAADSVTINFSAKELQDMASDIDPLTLASAQSQALYGRPTAVAQYRILMAMADTPEEQMHWWANYSDRFDKVNTSLGRLYVEQANDEMLSQDVRAIALQEALTAFRADVSNGLIEAGVDLGELLLKGPWEDASGLTDARRAEALAVLLPLAALGNGEALELLPLADPATYPDSAAVFAAYGDAIESNGDFAGILFALPHLTDPAQIATYKRRAAIATDCGYANAIDMAGVLGKMQDPDFRYWITAASALVDDTDQWQLTRLGDALSTLGGPEDADDAEFYYTAAYEAGGRTATFRLLSLFAEPATPRYDPAYATELYLAMIDRSKPDDYPAVLARLETEEAEITDAVIGQVNVEGLYLAAAEAGNVAAMREYALLRRDGAATPADITLVFDWLDKAAQAGDRPAMLELAKMLAFGIGAEADHARAVHWLELAAADGSAEAATLLNTLRLGAVVTQ